MNGIMIPIKVKHTLKDLRIRAGLSQEQAAKLFKVTEPTLRNWEKDSANLSYKTIERITEIYAIPQDYIFFGTDNAFSEMIKEG